MFKVVTDQLKVSQGWVRCGQCAEVFDAQLHLQVAPAPTPTPTLPITSSGPRPFNAVVDTPFRQGYDASSYEQDVIAALQMPSLKEPLSAPNEANLAGLAVPSEQGLQDPKAATESPISQVVDDADVSASALDDLSFVRDARRQAFWRKSWVQTLLVFFAVSLVGLLALQLVLQQRDAVLAFEPRSKPLLQLMCDQFGCDLGVPRRIEAIIIESSSFNKAEGIGSYRLTFSLKNLSAAVVAMPSLEVSLTDGQDQAVIRRVLSPTQFGAASSVLAASSEFSSTVTLQVQATSTSMRISGYRLLAFYP